MKKFIAAAAIAVAAPLAAAPAAHAVSTQTLLAGWTPVKVYPTQAQCASNGQWFVRNHEARSYRCEKVSSGYLLSIYA